jgi:hypothetical protein
VVALFYLAWVTPYRVAFDAAAYGVAFWFEFAVVGRCRLNQRKPVLKAPGTKRLKPKCDKLVSNVAFKFDLRRYTVDIYFILDVFLNFVTGYWQDMDDGTTVLISAPRPIAWHGGAG